MMRRLPLKIAAKIKAWIRRRIQKRRESRITLEGVIFIVITFFLGLAAINTSTNLLYLIMSMMLAFFMVSGILSTNTLKRLEMKRLAVKHVTAGQTALIQIEIQNSKKRASSYSLRVHDYTDGGRLIGACYLFHVGPRSRQTISYRVRFPNRGLYRLGRLKAISRFPFGFFERSFSINQPQEILVYPQIIDIRPAIEQAHLELGEYETGRKGPGHSLHGLREYTPGDSARHIHWKVSARSSKIMVREFEKEEKKKVTIWLNNHSPLTLNQEVLELFERGVIYAASLSSFLIQRDYQVQLATASGRVPFGMGIAHLYRILRALALIEIGESEGHDTASPSLDGDSTNVIIHYDARRSDDHKGGAAQCIDVTHDYFAGKEEIPLPIFTRKKKFKKVQD